MNESGDYAVQRLQMLWRAADGRGLLWVELLVWAIGALLLSVGVFGDSFGQRDSMISIVSGVSGLCILIGASPWRQRSQIDVLRELIKLGSEEAHSERLAS